METRERSAASSIKGAARLLNPGASRSRRRGIDPPDPGTSRGEPTRRQARGKLAASAARHRTRVTDLAWLRHPSERSRLVLAVAASVILAGLAVVLFAKRLERDQVIWTMAAGPAALAFGWVVLQIARAHLLGNAVRVTPESLPELDEVVEDVKQRLGYHRRVDVYVTDRVSGLMTLTSLFGTRIIMIEGDLVASLINDGKRPELTFLVARFIGALQSQRDRVVPLRLLVTIARSIGVVNVLIWPYDRAVVYSGDQIALAIAGDLDAALNALDRLLVGGTLGPSVRDAGVFDQASQIRSRRLPRIAQLFHRQPHLANRYVNLMAFAERYTPEQRAAVVAAMGEAGATRLGDLAKRTPHRSWHPSRRRLLTPAAGALATALVIAASALLLPAGGASGNQKVDPTLALLDHVPPSFAGSCVPAAEGIQGPLGRRLSASVVCTAAAPASVEYYRYGDRRAMQAAFDGLTNGVKDAGCGEDATYDRGRYACWRFRGASVLAWTDEKQSIVSLAVARGMQPHELLRWWQLDSGPI
jgi:hypothetical protein